MSKISCLVMSLALLVGMGTGETETRGASVVFTDSGNVGDFTFTNSGISGSTSTITVAVPGTRSTLDTVNGAPVSPELVKVSTPFSFTVTPTGGGLYTVVTPAGLTKTIGGLTGQQAILPFSLTLGQTSSVLPDFFNVSGPVTSVTSNNNPNYDFGLFSNGSGRINLTFTATDFTRTTDFAGLFSTVGATATGNGSFSQAVPEPASVVMLGLGLAGVAIATKIRHRFA